MNTFLIVLSAALTAQGGGSLSREADAADLVKRMTAFDKNGDGKLTREELTDRRLIGLFTRADADADGFVTAAELTALAEAEHSSIPDFDARRPPRPPGGPGRPGRPGPGGPGGPGDPGFDGFPGPPASRPGEVLSPPVRQALRLSPEQRARVDELQKKVDDALSEILTDAQKADLQRALPPGAPR